MELRTELLSIYMQSICMTCVNGGGSHEKTEAKRECMIFEPISPESAKTQKWKMLALYSFKCMLHRIAAHFRNRNIIEAPESAVRLG